MKRYVLAVLLSFVAADVARADAVGYQGIVDINASAGGVTCQHYHDWSSATGDARFAMISGKTGLFSSANTYAWLTCSKDGAQLFRSPAPAFTRLVMSDDGRFVAGVTNVKLWNPVQIAVWQTSSGERLFAAEVSSLNACFSPDGYAKFLAAHPSMRGALHERAVLVGGVVRADIVYRDSDEAALHELVAKSCPSYIARNITESVSNWVEFYAGASAGSSGKVPDPRFRFENGSDGKPAYLEFLDTAGVPARVNLHPHYVETAAP
jgi:hypothetical protein